MFSNRIRTAIVTLAASAGFGFAAMVPTPSEALWHNYCVKGHCQEHANYTYGNPCGSGQAAALTPEAQKEAERKKKEEEEGKVHGEEIEKSFYGCDVSPSGSSSGGSGSSPGSTSRPSALASGPVAIA